MGSIEHKKFMGKMQEAGSLSGMSASYITKREKGYIRMIFKTGKVDSRDKDTIRTIDCEVNGVKIATIDEEIPSGWDRDRYPHNVFRLRVVDMERSSNSRRMSKWSLTSHGSYATLLQAKRAAEQWYGENKASFLHHTKASVRLLPADPCNSFYPTPSRMAGIMLSRVDWKRVGTILEPSAGKGDLVEAIFSALEDNDPDRLYYSHRVRWGLHMSGRLSQSKDIDVIEIDENLQQLLIGKGLNLVHDDFLTYSTRKNYDLIIMNPPFDAGDQHLLKAISMMEDTGGQIICLLNAETIRNQCTNGRYLLGQRLKEFDARIEFYSDAFRHAERKTDVEVALVTLDIPSKPFESHIWEAMKKAEREQFESSEPNAIVSGDWVEQMVSQYNMEVDAGVALIKEYGALVPYIVPDNSDGNREKPALIRISVGKEKDISIVDSGTINEYLRCVRNKYWRTLLDRPEISGKMTSEISKQYYKKLDTLSTYDFSLFNIRRFIIELSAQLNQGVIDSIHSLFHTLSEKYSWYPESEKNIHYYSGWRTNEAHKVGMKAIIPVNGYDTNYRGLKETKELDVYCINSSIRDLEKALTYLDGGKFGICHVDVRSAAEFAKQMGKTTVSFTYFTATFYKKGTCHIKFYPEAKPLIDRMNIMVGREKAWLPPCYGKVSYEAMDEESRAVVDSFQTKKEYEAVCAEPGYYLSGTMGFPSLTA